MVPLSLGRLEGDNVICGYHGLEFDDTGRCVYMPSQDTINPSACVKSYPIAEKHRFIWIWPGDPALADPALIPDMHWNKDPAWAADGKLIEVKCDYRLVVDNLMDLTHETFVHGSSIGNRAVAEAPFEASHSDRFAYITRWMENIDPPPSGANNMGGPARSIAGRSSGSRRHAPSPSMSASPKRERAPRRATGPRASTAMCSTRSRRPPTRPVSISGPSPAITISAIRRGRMNCAKASPAFSREDEVVLEAQQAAIDANPDHQFYNLNIDAGSMWARKLIDRMIEQENPAFSPRVVAAE